MPTRPSRFIAILAVALASSGCTSCKSEKKVAQKPALPAAESGSGHVGGPPPTSPEVTFPSEGLVLHGFLAKPPGAGPFPAFLYNHGSEKKPGDDPLVRDFFVSKGYVFFIPHRRGHGRSPGPYVSDVVKESDDKARTEVTELEKQATDVSNALTYLKSLPYVDKARIVTGGCSFGGIETLLAAERDQGLRAAIDWAGDAESWHNEVLKKRLLKAVDNLKIPIFFLQAQNDYTTGPTETFAAEAARKNKPHKSKIFPPHGTTHEEGHGGFCTHGSQEWGADVIAFLQQQGG